jgi:hypothetical protein
MSAVSVTLDQSPPKVSCSIERRKKIQRKVREKELEHLCGGGGRERKINLSRQLA